MARLLENYIEQARRAHYWTSFSPEKRGEQLVNEFSEQLHEDLDAIKNMAISVGVESFETTQQTYQQKYERYFSCWLSAKSNCFSVMITGGSGFNNRRHAKANNAEHNRYTDFQEWRNRILAAIKKSYMKSVLGTPLEEMSKKLNKAMELQQMYHLINKAYRAWKKLPQLETLEIFDLSEDYKTMIMTWVPKYSFERAPIQSFKFTNLNANIKRMQQRVNDLTKKEDLATTGENPEIPFDGGKVILNYEMDRIQIVFPGKPAPEMIKRMRSLAMKWAPSQGAWQRQLTNNAKWCVARELNITIN